jgi:hypothetical protein
MLQIHSLESYSFRYCTEIIPHLILNSGCLKLSQASIKNRVKKLYEGELKFAVKFLKQSL